MPKAMEKSAKDLAFDKERIKYSRMIRAAEQETKRQVSINSELKDRINILEAQNREKDDWIERLLNYMDLTPEQFASLIEEERKAAKTVDSVAELSFETYLNALMGSLPFIGIDFGLLPDETFKIDSEYVKEGI